MHPHFVSPNHATQWFWRLLFLAALLILLFLLTYRVAAAQCIPNPTGETSVGLQNDSRFYLTFHIDGIRKDGVPTGDRSVDFVVTPGEHILLAETVIAGENVMASRTTFIPKGFVCTWTVINPPAKTDKARREFQNSLQQNRLRAFVPLAAL